MSRANDMAFPADRDDTPNNTVQPGLTIREHFAAMAMQGILASDTTNDLSAPKVVRWSVEMADAIIAELAKEPK